MKMMKLAFAATLAVVAIAAIAQQGHPRQGPGHPGQGGHGQGGPGHGHPGQGAHPPMLMRHLMGPAIGLPPLMMVLHRDDVRQELGITDAQLEQFHEMFQQFGPPQPPPPAEGGQAPPPLPDHQQLEKHHRQLEAKVRGILTAAQNKRVDEIRVQIAGLTAALDEGIQAKLDVTAEQKKQLGALAPKRGPGTHGGPQGGPGFGPPPPGGPGGHSEPQGGPPGAPGFGPPPQGGQMRQGGPGGPRNDPHRQALETKIKEILSDRQEAALKALGGKEFKPARRED